MKWIIVIFVNFLPVTAQWEMYDYSDNPFDSEVACLQFVVQNKQFLIDEANRAYRRNDKDYVIGEVTDGKDIDEESEEDKDESDVGDEVKDSSTANVSENTI